MKKLGRDIVLDCAKVLNVILVTLPFALCWFGYYAERIAAPFYGRGNWLLALTFSALYIIFAKVYDALLISFQRVSDIVCSQLLSLLLADGIMFLVLCLLTRHFPNIFPALAALGGQVFLAVVWSLLADKCYFALFPARPSAVVYDSRCEMDTLVREYGLERKFDIRFIASVDECLSDIHMLDDVEAVFLNDLHSHDRNVLLKYCIEKDILVYTMPRVGDMLMLSARRRHMFHLPVLQVERCHPSPAYLFIKRLVDILFSLAAILLLSPVMIATAIAIKVYDGGPILYKQARLTQNGKCFQMLKFRSMRVNAEEDGIARLSTGDSDDRITPVGRMIRRLRVDELPQLFCTLAGSMSLVGPRPERPEIAAQYEAELPEFALRLQVKAGLTGYAQVYGKYNTLPYDKLQMDLMYIAHPSILEDFRILLATIKVLFIPESTEGIQEDAMIGRESRASKMESTANSTR